MQLDEKINHGGELKPAEPMLRASSSSVSRSEVCEATIGAGAGADAPARSAGVSVPLPCLNTINCNEGGKKKEEKLSAGHRKTAYALKLNVVWLIEKHGLEKVGFLTLTFARHIVAYKVAQKALHSLITGVIRRRYVEYIIVMERMTSKRIHYHLLVVMAEDIRTGFDFVAVKRGDYRSASDYLRREWVFWRLTAPKYGFGRTELLPIKKTAEGVAKYIGKYVAKHIGQRLAEDKGARLVRYSKRASRVGTRFGWHSSGAAMWRAKLGTFCRMLGLTSDNYKESLRDWYGRNWVYILQPLIESIKLPAFYPVAESQASQRAAWAVAVNERERRRPKRKEPVAKPVQFPARPVMPAKSWIELTMKEED